MLTSGWLDKFINTLKQQANIGVTGPIDPNRNLLTQAFVHRVHFQIFEPMYPNPFKNWYMDNWMELVYSKFTKPVDDCFAENSPHPPRYKIDTEAYKYLEQELLNGCLAIQFFLKSNSHSQWRTFQCSKVEITDLGENRSVYLEGIKYSLTDPLPIPDSNSNMVTTLKKYANEDNIIMITFTNFGFLEMTYNWLINVAYHNIDNYLVIALDEDAYSELIGNGFHCFYDSKFSTNNRAAEYLEGHYRELVNLKTFYNLRILSLGFHTLLCDNDIALLKNPLSDELLNNDYDIQIQDDSQSIDKFTAVNTGFQFVRSNQLTVLFYKEVYLLTQTNSELQDQRAYNTILQSTKFKHLLKWNILNQLEYPNGWIYFISQLPQKYNIEPTIIHNNWIRGLESKKHRFREHHLWFIDKSYYYTEPSLQFITYLNTNKISNLEQQTEELYQAILLSRILKRILIFPPFRTFDNLETNEFCGIETLYDIAKIGIIVPYREHSFLTNKIHLQSEYTPLKNAQLLDIIQSGEKTCLSEENQCFHPGHKGFILLNPPKVVTAKSPFSLQQVDKLIGSNSSFIETPLIIIPTILGNFKDLESHFSNAELIEIQNALKMRSAPHLK